MYLSVCVRNYPVMVPLMLCQVVSCPGVPTSMGAEPHEHFFFQDKQLSPSTLALLLLHPSRYLSPPLLAVLQTKHIKEIEMAWKERGRNLSNVKG